MYNTITLMLDNPLTYGETLHVELQPIITGDSQQFQSEAEQAMRLTTIVLALAKAGLKIDMVQSDMLYTDEAVELSRLRQENERLQREVKEAQDDAQYHANRVRALVDEVNNLKLGPLEVRLERGKAWMEEGREWGTPITYGDCTPRAGTEQQMYVDSTLTVPGHYVTKVLTAAEAERMLKVDRIKHIRSLTGLGLKEAKDFVETYAPFNSRA